MAAGRFDPGTQGPKRRLAGCRWLLRGTGPRPAAALHVAVGCRATSASRSECQVPASRVLRRVMSRPGPVPCAHSLVVRIVPRPAGRHPETANRLLLRILSTRSSASCRVVSRRFLAAHGVQRVVSHWSGLRRPQMRGCWLPVLHQCPDGWVTDRGCTAKRVTGSMT